jgi:hypothetical protein
MPSNVALVHFHSFPLVHTVGGGSILLLMEDGGSPDIPWLAGSVPWSAGSADSEVVQSQ